MHALGARRPGREGVDVPLVEGAYGIPHRLRSAPKVFGIFGGEFSRTFASRIWHRRITKASLERSPASSRSRSFFDKSRTKTGGFMEATIDHYTQPSLRMHYASFLKYGTQKCASGALAIWECGPTPMVSLCDSIAGWLPAPPDRSRSCRRNPPRPAPAAEHTPPRLDEVQPRCSFRDKGVLDPGMLLQPVPYHGDLVGFEVVGDHVDEPLRDGTLYLLQQSQVAFGVS